MTYFIWQGKDSRDVENLIVNAAPRVTFPGKRYNELYVNGRNGSIITENGLSAYDIEITMSLKGEAKSTSGSFNYTGYSALTNFFYGSCDDRVKNKLIISTRPDVYYDAYLLEAVDVEKLLRYKTFSVKFHVQPTKGLYIASADSYGYYYRDTKTSGSSITGMFSSLKGSDIPRKPKLYIQPNYTFDTRTNIQIDYYSTPDVGQEGWCGKRMRTSVLSVFLPSGCKPVIVIDLATDDYYVCNNNLGDLNDATDPQTFRKYTKDRALFSLTAHLRSDYDIYYSGTRTYKDVSLWHDITFNGLTDVCTLKRYDADTETKTGTYTAILCPEVVVL